jgi:crotonobetainyl-CoA:carnitine CoA-transferase CaiB-like acyl-CoA transferase
VAAVLEGVRVLDFGRYIAGPYCAALLGDLGAEVIRVERVGGGEDRDVAPVAPGQQGPGAMFLVMNRNKKSMTLDPGSLEGREIVKQLVQTADVVVANLPPSVLRSLSLDLDSLRKVKPDIILTTVTAYGPGGPLSHKHGFDGIGQAMSGSAYLTGTEDQPYTFRAPWVDCGTASLSAFGTLAALLSKMKTGKGQRVEGALLQTAVAFGNAHLVEQQLTKVDRVPTKNRGQTAAPSDLFQCKDGEWIVVQTIGDAMFRRWCELVGELHWLDDPKYRDDIRRGDNSEAISESMAKWCRKHTALEALAALEKVKIPSGQLYKPQQTLEDPHIWATGMLQKVDFPGLSEPAPIAPTPVRLSETPGEIRHRAPLLGEHTEEIMTSLGYDRTQIAVLKQKGVI